MQNPYQVLGLQEDATITSIKEQYRELSKVFHPDKQRQYYNQSVEIFEKIDSAYKIIGNEFMKMVYDNFGPLGVQLVQDNKQMFQTLEWEYQQGRNVVEKMRSQLYVIQLQEQELNSYTILKQYSFEAVLQNTFICTINKNQSNAIAHMAQILELPKWKQIEFALKSEYSIFRINNNSPQKRGLMRNYLLAQFGFNIPLLRVCNFEIQASLEDFTVDRIIIKKKFQLGEALLNFQKYGEHFVPSIATAIGKQGRSIQVNLDYQNLAIVTDAQINSKQNIQISLANGFQSISFVQTLFQDQNYVSLLRLSYHKAQVKARLFLSSEFRVQYSHIHFDWKSIVYHNGLMSIQFAMSRINSSLRLPFTFNIEDPIYCLLWMIAPQILPFIWSKGWLNPWKKLQENKRQTSESKIEEYQKANLEARILIGTGENYQKYLQYEKQSNGLIIAEAYLGELTDIKQFFKEGIPNKYLVNAKEQLQAEVIDNGLFLPAESIDRLDGFFKTQSKKNSNQFWGHVKYFYQGKEGTRMWNWSEPLSIGNVCKQNKDSIVEAILGLIYK